MHDDDASAPPTESVDTQEIPDKSPLATPATWDQVSSAYAESVVPHFGHYAEDAMRAIERSGRALDGTDVLDVACGPGTLSFLVAPRVRRVAAIDFSMGMIEALRARARRDRVKNVEAELMDAQTLTFHDGSFDAAFMMFGAMFIPDRSRAFREIKRVLRPGGRLAITTWTPLENSPLLSGMVVAMRALIPELPSPALELHDEASVRAALADAGFDDVEVQLVRHAAHFESADDYWHRMMDASAPFVPLRRRFGEERWPAFSHAVLEKVRENFGHGPLQLDAEAILAVARK